MSAHFSPIMMQAALVLPETTVGMIDASAIRSPLRPWTRSSWSTTAIGVLAGPIAQVPLGWKIVPPRARA
jgi:cytochrome c biogenesis factor